MRKTFPSPFFSSRLELIELARRRYFEEGVRPSGIVSDAVIQSWARCQKLHYNPASEVVFQPVTASRTHLALQRNRELRDAWLQELPQLQVILGTTSCAAVLTDATGVLIGATCTGRAHERLTPIGARVGVDLSEKAVGTTAPGVVARTGQPVCVLGAEHFFDNLKAMHCAASPIRDIHGHVAGVLDITSESIPFRFDAASLVGHLAGAMENRLLLAQSNDHLVIRLQIAASLLDSPAVGLVGVNAAGRIAWLNGVASRLLGLPGDLEAVLPSAEAELGTSITRLASLPRAGAVVLPLPNGLAVWVRTEMRARDGHRALVDVLRASGDGSDDRDLEFLDVSVEQLCAPAPNTGSIAGQSPASSSSDGGKECPDNSSTVCDNPVAASTTLRDCDRDHIERTVRECKGNMSEAARKLGVSRGLIYRRLGRACAPLRGRALKRVGPGPH